MVFFCGSSIWELKASPLPKNRFGNILELLPYEKSILFIEFALFGSGRVGSGGFEISRAGPGHSVP